MPRGQREGPVLPPPPAALAAAVERIRRIHRKDPAAAFARVADDPPLGALLSAHLAADAALGGDAAAAQRFAAAALAAAPRGDAGAAALLSVACAAAAAGDRDREESSLLDAVALAGSDLCRGAGLARLAMAYAARGIPLGFRFYAGRALRLLDQDGVCGVHPAVDRDAARLAAELLEYLHRRDEPGRGSRAHAVLERVRDVLPECTVRGLKFHGLAMGRLKDWEAARRAFLEAARIAEARSLRGCDGVYVYAAAVRAQEGDFPGARRLLSRAHIRRLDDAEKALFRQFRHLVAAAAEHRPLRGERARRFLTERGRVTAEGDPEPAEPPPEEPAPPPPRRRPAGAPRRPPTTPRRRTRPPGD